jgi:hypothetical protein
MYVVCLVVSVAENFTFEEKDFTHNARPGFLVFFFWYYDYLHSLAVLFKIKNPLHTRYTLHISWRWVGIIHLESPFRLQCQRSTASGQSQDKRLQSTNLNSSPIINGKTPNAQSEKQIERRKISWALYQPLCPCCCLRDA